MAGRFTGEEMLTWDSPVARVSMVIIWALASPTGKETLMMAVKTTTGSRGMVIPGIKESMTGRLASGAANNLVPTWVILENKLKVVTKAGLERLAATVDRMRSGGRRIITGITRPDLAVSTAGILDHLLR